MIEEKYVIFIAIEFAVSFFIFGTIWQSWRSDDIANGREKFWLFKHYWNKITK